MRSYTSQEDGDEDGSELSYLQPAANDPDDSSSVTGDLLAGAEDWHAPQHTTHRHNGLSHMHNGPASPRPNDRPSTATRIPPINSHISPHKADSRLSPIRSLKDEKTPTARHFSLADPTARTEVSISPRAVTFDMPSERRYYGEESAYYAVYHVSASLELISGALRSFADATESLGSPLILATLFPVPQQRSASHNTIDC